MSKEDLKIESNKVEVSKKEWEAVQEKLRMLEEVADKGRILNYQTKNAPTKQPITVKISEYNDKYIVGWRTKKFELGRSPTTGRTIWGGETAEYEVKFVDKEGNETTEVINGYSAFSDARYDKRVDCAVLAKKETNEGKFLYDVALPGGKVITIDLDFVN